MKKIKLSKKLLLSSLFPLLLLPTNAVFANPPQLPSMRQVQPMVRRNSLCFIPKRYKSLVPCLKFQLKKAKDFSVFDKNLQNLLPINFVHSSEGYLKQLKGYPRKINDLQEREKILPELKEKFEITFLKKPQLLQYKDIEEHGTLLSNLTPMKDLKLNFDFETFSQIIHSESWKEENKELYQKLITMHHSKSEDNDSLIDFIEESELQQFIDLILIEQMKKREAGGKLFSVLNLNGYENFFSPIVLGMATEIFPHISELHLKNNDFVGGLNFKILSRFLALNRLNLDNTKITEKGFTGFLSLAALGVFENLKELNLSRNHDLALSLPELKSVAKNFPLLQKLHLSQIDATDELLKNFCALPRLRHLNLSHNTFSFSAIEEMLSHSKNLKVLDISFNKFPECQKSIDNDLNQICHYQGIQSLEEKFQHIKIISEWNDFVPFDY